MNAQRKKELRTKITAETREISGLLKLISATSVCLARDANDWSLLGSLVHIRELLVELLTGFHYQPDEEETETAERILLKARKLADFRVVGNHLQHRVQGIWMSVPGNDS